MSPCSEAPSNDIIQLTAAALNCKDISCSGCQTATAERLSISWHGVFMKHFLTMALILVSAFLISNPGVQDKPRPTLFQEIGPIEGADPERRHVETVAVPTALIVESKPNGTYVGFDQQSTCKLKLMVGHKMVVGCEWTLYYFRGTERVELRRNTGGSLGSLMDGGRHVVQGLQEIADVRGSLQLIAELSVFETDIPPQHMWMPKKGMYQLLWKGVATGVLATN